MAARGFKVDSGGTSRLARRIFKVDSGGTSRLIRRHFRVDSGGTSRLVFTAAYGTLSLGRGTDGISQFGYNSAFFGTLTPDSYTDGSAVSRTVSVLVWDGSTVGLTMSAAGVPNTDATFSSLGLDSTTLLRSAATYDGAASGGTRTRWTWTDSFSGGVTVTVNFYS